MSPKKRQNLDKTQIWPNLNLAGLDSSVNRAFFMPAGGDPGSIPCHTTKYSKLLKLRIWQTIINRQLGCLELKVVGWIGALRLTLSNAAYQSKRVNSFITLIKPPIKTTKENQWILHNSTSKLLSEHSESMSWLFPKYWKEVYF